MKKSWKKVVLVFLGVLLAIILSLVIYFYLALEGNPLVRWQERREVLGIFEEVYGQNFTVVSSSYDYKRGEFDFVLYSEENPSITFRTSLDQTMYKDAYGEARSRSFVCELVTEALGSDFDYLDYHMNVFEDYKAEDPFETDLIKRIEMNSYVADFSWDVRKVDAAKVDAILEELTERIEDGLGLLSMEIKVRVGVYDGREYYFNDRLIER